MIENLSPEEWLASPYVATAAYFSDSDCVEYVNEDCVCVYRRIDEFLTLIFDETKIRLIGFKLKGFRFFFERMKGHLQLNNSDFIWISALIEEICRDIGDELETSKERRLAYQAVKKIADKEQVKLVDLPKAA